MHWHSQDTALIYFAFHYRIHIFYIVNYGDNQFTLLYCTYNSYKVDKVSAFY